MHIEHNGMQTASEASSPKESFKVTRAITQGTGPFNISTNGLSLVVDELTNRLCDTGKGLIK